jgi:hypothetical protein
MTNCNNRRTYTTQQPRKAPLSEIWLCKFWREAGGEVLPRVKSTDYKIGSNQAYLLTFRARRIARDADVRSHVESRHLPNFNRLWNNYILKVGICVSRQISRRSSGCGDTVGNGGWMASSARALRTRAQGLSPPPGGLQKKWCRRGCLYRERTGHQRIYAIDGFSGEDQSRDLHKCTHLEFCYHSTV